MVEVFPVAPGSAKPFWFFAGVAAVLLVILGLLAYTAWSTRNSRLEISSDQLRLVGDLWGRSIPLHALEVERAAVLDLDRDAEFTLRRRTLGTSLPGYSSGWFRLSNGEKALVYLTRRHDVVYVPTTRGYALLLTPEQPRAFLDSLRTRTGR